MAPDASPADALTVVVGEALVDIVVSPDGSSREHVGGSPANVAIGLARLGHPVELATHIGDDERGRRVRAHLERDGVRLVEGSVTAARTPTATATLDEAGVATYTFDLAWDLPADLGPGTAAHVHIGSIATALQPGAEQVRRIVEQARVHSTVSFDPNLRPAILGAPEPRRPGVESLVALCDVVKASDEDLSWLYAGESVDSILSRWATLGPSLVVCTLGGEGARVLVGGEFFTVPPMRVKVVDTVGAGDSFMGALISGLLDAGLLGSPAGRTALATADPAAVRPALDRAIRVAGITCSRAGADPPYRREL
ncbi:MAG: carbohydrate kinase [Actinomycetota bacterium]|nr:carbohydrate kinase [Actinomycetota bacterium]